MYDPKYGWSLSFSGCGFLGFYHLGATQCLSDRAPHLLRDARMFFGASAGSLHCVSFVAGVPLDLVWKARSRTLGTLHPSFNMSQYFRDSLHRYLPDNVHQLISGKVGISLTRVSDLENVVVSDFQSKDEVVDAVLCSIFVPFFCGMIPPSFRGVRYMDGGVSNSIPFSDTKTTITVSPFYGEYDICPKVKSTNFFHVDVSKLSLRICLQNLYLLSQTLFPPDIKVLGEICLRGYLDAARFLEENGLCDRPPAPCPSLSSKELEVLTLPQETRSLEASREGAGWQTRLEGDELLDHLRRSLLPWDESILQTVSPELTTVLSEVARTRGGYMSKICSLLPVKVLSYVMLPCTLPVESAIAAVQRLVMWLPDIPDDVQWLQSIACQACSRVTKYLFPACRFPGSSVQRF
ncbi:1-acylglycerol-3-phosphate O-acyltransferase PNPLA3 isoform X2 [Desmodus rotundus]|uniref:1-acylglycerol-3-phosphate O-acyltransferase PNPLA3 isoform X2 n=1 Tax=Desmodus rotundus TaxID=9430 RepID=UPI0023816843|nr:1-acylglycerol-3-phosphate O-acyltransferase PNPLA3 isoform X2 [Desmodus rotundus]